MLRSSANFRHEAGTKSCDSGPRPKTLCYSGELSNSAQSGCLKSVDVFIEHGDRERLKLFPSDVAASTDDSQVAQVLVNKDRLERARLFGACSHIMKFGARTFRMNEAPACLPGKQSSVNSSTKASSNDANLQRNSETVYFVERVGAISRR
jgi:hypothetical protein